MRDRLSIEVAQSDMAAWLEDYDGTLFDACVTDPPYHLTSIVKRFGADGAAPARKGKSDGATGAYARASKGFMGQTWDGGDVAFRPETWAAVYARLKPGAHLIAFSGTRTYHRMACAIEDAGFEIRDCLMWVYGSGFPKSHNMAGVWAGWGTALKPALEPICLARKPLSEKNIAANVMRHGTGALHVDACRVGTDGGCAGAGAGARVFGNGLNGSFAQPVPGLGRWPANLVHDGSDEVLAGFPETDAASGRQRNNGAFKSVAKGHDLPHVTAGHDDNGGSASRFFYSAKAGPLDRLGSDHPTVKPVDLMRWLVRMVCPVGGRVLEPFAGSGTTGIACMAEGLNCQMIDMEAKHVADITRKIDLLRGEGRGLFDQHLNRRVEQAEPESLPLFGFEGAAS